MILGIVIATTVVSFFTLNTSKLFAIRRIQQVCIVYFTGFSAAPIPIVLAARFIPGSGKQKFGKLGSMSTKVYIVVVASLILSMSPSSAASH